ncbi:glycosyltransferase family 4 protein [Candidatus Venteria ishoeyi]|uniref:Alpha-D-kanosaminyltransferase n=1 Tax=Candidatus Venteria ishoeyi TaxID=1899563 RepID=A0A1H6F5T1_9GAMM|nr:glycosyltransferase family 4 protein [Candidatus Venteria ishoeyi]SEH04345.1 Alpha-D-kanosaminyltransferase [Candidatus Venteria ishoeyi]
MPKKKTILAYLTSDFPVLSHTFISREVKGLEKLGYSIRHLSIHRPAAEEISKEDEVFKGKVFYIFPLKKWDFIWTHIRFLLRMPLRYLYYFFYIISRPDTRLHDRIRTVYHFAEAVYLAAEVERQGITHIHAHFYHNNATIALLVAKLLGISYSITAHGSALLIERVLIKEKTESAQFILCISQYNKNFILKHYPQYADKVFVVHCGLNPQQFLPAPPPANDKLTLLAIGRFVPVKAYADLLKACFLLKQQGLDFRCVLIGDGPESEKLQQLIADYQLQDVIEMPGIVLQEKIQAYFEQADIFVLSSISEGIPVVLMEAMSKQVPVVATHITGIPELVEDGVSGYLPPPANPEAFAAAIQKLATDAALRQRMGQAGRNKILAEFDIEKNILERKAIYDRYLT